MLTYYYYYLFLLEDLLAPWLILQSPENLATARSLFLSAVYIWLRSLFILKLGQVFGVNPHQLFLWKDPWCFKKEHWRVNCLDSCLSRRRSYFTQKSYFLRLILKLFKGNPNIVCERAFLPAWTVIIVQVWRESVCLQKIFGWITNVSC